MKLNIKEFDYPFDPSLVAQYPLPERDQARLLVLDREKGTIEHRRFFEIGDYLKEGDLLVLNDTRVIPCRLAGRKEKTGGRVELLLIKRLQGDTWEVMSGDRLREGLKITFSSTCSCEIMSISDEYAIATFSYEGRWESVLSNIGKAPLPPYIKRNPVEDDREWYQTVYASEDGSIAAPTAGLHFTGDMLRTLSSKGVITTYITLHIGTGTFKPVKVEWVEDHKMSHEWFEVGEDAADLILKVKNKGAKIVAVGTTSVRALEQAAAGGEIKAMRGETALFIYPGFRFNVVDAIITNFHLPKSTLLMLIMAFAGREKILKAYEEAVGLRYWFYSYGDAMLIL